MNADDIPDDDFFEGPEDHDPPARSLRVVRGGEVGDAWREKLAIGVRSTGRGKDKRITEYVIPNLANVVTILSDHPAWRKVLAYDLFSERIITTKPPPWHEDDAPSEAREGELQDTDTARFVLWFYRAERLTVAERLIEQAIGVVAEKHLVHPVRDYLKALKWDGVKRLDEAASVYFGAALTEYSRAVVPRWFISAVARAMQPGAQCDCVLILEGATGWKKSSAFRALVPKRELYADSGIIIGSKDSYQNIHGVWLYGFDELDSLSKADLTATKNFITQTYDRYRPPFGKAPKNFHRQNVFCGSTNKDDYLNDPTGDRRYWPLTVLRPIDDTIIVRDRDQLWAEAKTRYDAGERWHVDTPELRKLCEEQQRSRVADDAWIELVVEWLKNPVVPDTGPDGRYPELWPTVDLVEGVTTGEALLGAVRKKASEITRTDQTRMGQVLRLVGLTELNRTQEDGSRSRRYRRPLKVST